MAISAHIETNIIDEVSVGQTNVWLKSDCDKTKFYESLWKKNKKCYQGKNKILHITARFVMKLEAQFKIFRVS